MGLLALGARFSAALTTDRLRVEAMRILFLLRERFYMRLIALASRKLRQTLVPAEERAREAVLTSLTAAVQTHANAVNRLASAVEALASTEGDGISRPLVPRQTIAALAAEAVAEAPSIAEAKTLVQASITN